MFNTTEEIADDFIVANDKITSYMSSSNSIYKLHMTAFSEISKTVFISAFSRLDKIARYFLALVSN